MNVFINAISIHGGGAFVVLSQLLEAMHHIEPNVNWYIAAKSSILAKLPTSKTIFKLPYTWANRSPLHLFYWYEVVLPKLLRETETDVCFSQTNYLPKRRLRCPSLLLVQHAGHFSDEFDHLFLESTKKRSQAFAWKRKKNWVYNSIKQASLVTVQTNALAIKIIEQINIPKEKIIVIPHGPGLLKNSESFPREYPITDIWKIGYITKFGVQKDFDTVIKALMLLKNRGIPIKLILTLNEKEPECHHILKKISKNGIEDLVENYGEVTNIEDLKKLYYSLHIFIFPSLCESFGFPLVEAISSGLPVIIADTESNREVSGFAGEVFSSRNEKELVEKISALINNKHLYTLLSKKSIERAKQICWIQTAQSMLNVIYQLVNTK